MGVYKTRWFSRWADREGISGASLCEAVNEMITGLIDADLGGGLVKKRIAQPGGGKSGGYRTLVATNKSNRWVYVFGFTKNKRSNIGRDETEALKKLAAHVLSLPVQAVVKAQSAGELIEVDCNAKD